MSRWTELERACDAVLIESLPQSLKDAIRDGLAAGIRPCELLKRVRRIAGRTSTTALGVEAYLGQLRGDGPDDEPSQAART